MDKNQPYTVTIHVAAPGTKLLDAKQPDVVRGTSMTGHMYLETAHGDPTPILDFHHGWASALWREARCPSPSAESLPLCSARQDTYPARPTATARHV